MSSKPAPTSPPPSLYREAVATGVVAATWGTLWGVARGVEAAVKGRAPVMPALASAVNAVVVIAGALVTKQVVEKNAGASPLQGSVIGGAVSLGLGMAVVSGPRPRPVLLSVLGGAAAGLVVHELNAYTVHWRRAQLAEVLAGRGVPDSVRQALEDLNPPLPEMPLATGVAKNGSAWPPKTIVAGVLVQSKDEYAADLAARIDRVQRMLEEDERRAPELRATRPGASKGKAESDAR